MSERAGTPRYRVASPAAVGDQAGPPAVTWVAFAAGRAWSVRAGAAA